MYVAEQQAHEGTKNAYDSLARLAQRRADALDEANTRIHILTRKVAVLTGIATATGVLAVILGLIVGLS